MIHDFTGKYFPKTSSYWKIFANSDPSHPVNGKYSTNFSATIAGNDMDAMKIQLEKSNAFKAHDEATLRIVSVYTETAPSTHFSYVKNNS